MRVIAIADSDSYVKWAASLLAAMPAEWDTQLVVVRTTKTPSAAQFDAALSGTGRDVASVAVLDFDDMVRHVASERPDAVLVATIGPLADIVAESVLGASRRRPVLLSGMPGIALPVRRKALVYRSQVDLIVLHSLREVRGFRELAAEHGFSHEFGLARLPFLSTGSREGTANSDAATDIVFAAQAIVPGLRSERVRLLGWLVDLAAREPDYRVVLKLRALEGEAQTHPEAHSYAALLREEYDTVPSNLVIEAGPMAEQLDTARALVTVSSTAALEAAARGIPVLAINEFGVTTSLLNEVFIGSGMLGSARDLVEARFETADGEWLHDNYFHDSSENTWLSILAELVERNRAGTLPGRPRHVRGRGGILRRAWDRRRALGRYDTSVLGSIAVFIGTPLRTAHLATRELAELAAETDGRATRRTVALNDAAPALDSTRPEPRRTL